ncbi:MAG: YceI family protein [Parcubacteria group bacterium]|nr:YceI family protein [Parcubacteria group bacterium]
MAQIFLISTGVVLLVFGVSYFASKSDLTSDAVNIVTKEKTRDTVSKEFNIHTRMNTSVSTIASNLPFDASYSLKASQSAMQWKAERIVGNSHTGTVSIAAGKLFSKDEVFVDGEFVIDMSTISESKDNQQFLGHIKSADFFDVQQFPTSRLKMKNILKKSERDFDITADLTIKGQTHEITFPAAMEKTATGLKSTASFSIDRTKWGITYDSGTIFQQIGDKAIRDLVPFTLNLVFEKDAK